jgi:hypothetical protein
MGAVVVMKVCIANNNMEGLAWLSFYLINHIYIRYVLEIALWKEPLSLA